MTELLGRKLATVVQSGPRFSIVYYEPSRHEGVNRGPYDTLDAALQTIEKRTIGWCRKVAR